MRDTPWHALRREIALPAIARVLAGDPAERVLDKALRGLARDERRALADAVFGVGLWRRRLAWQARSDDPAALLDALIAGLENEPQRLADSWSLPDWLEAHLLGEFGPEEADAFCRAIAEPGPICLRANRLLCTREQLQRQLSFPTRFTARAPDGLIVEQRPVNLFGEAAWRDGWFEPQDEGSQLVTELVRGAQVLDLCAGAGGKSLQLAARGAKVLAYDLDRSKLDRLRTRAARARASIEILEEPREAESVLIDAPCGELGTLRRGPDLRWRLDPSIDFTRVQRGLLAQAAELARREIVYVTCTVSRAENEEMAAWFGARWRLEETLKLLPHRDGTDGFYAARFTRG